jgi:hypothetical protein
MALLARLRDAVASGLIEHHWDDAQLRRMEEQLAALDLLADARRALQSERGFCNDAAEWIRRAPLKERVKFLKADADFSDDSSGPQAWTRAVLQGRLFREQRDSNEMLDRCLDQLDQGFQHLFVRGSSPAPRKTNAATERLSMIVVSTLERYAALHVSLVQTRLACALERHRIRSGSYPPTLSALVPDFIAEVPLDLIDGQPMRYQPTSSNTFQIYSVGPNGEDDQGSPAFGPRRSKHRQTLDWVWNKRWR